MKYLKIKSIKKQKHLFYTNTITINPYQDGEVQEILYGKTLLIKTLYINLKFAYQKIKLNGNGKILGLLKSMIILMSKDGNIQIDILKNINQQNQALIGIEKENG